MTSPAKIPFISILNIDKKSNTALYVQIAQQMINAIQRGFLMIGTKLPGTRVLSELLQVHRQTVIAAYQELESQGWLESIPNKGTYIIHRVDTVKPMRIHDKIDLLAQYPQQTGFTFTRSSILDNPFQDSSCALAFTDGTPDIRLSSIYDLSSMYSASMKRKQMQRKMEHHTHDSNDFFRVQLSNYLNLTRGLHISPQNLLITRSTEMSLYLLSQLILKDNDVVLVADLSFFSANMIFQKAGARILSIPIDEEGISVAYIREHFKPNEIRMIYITPHYHYPTTVTLSANRRVELLQLASAYHFIIVEDDYDFEFQYEPSALLPLASSDLNGMVIYVGTFGKSLAPGFRTGFVVAPENLMLELRKYLGIIDRQGDVVMEQVLGEMIEEGTIFRHLKKSLKEYKNRRDHFCALLDLHFPEQVSYIKPKGGLAIWTKWNPEISLLKVSQQSLLKGLFIPQTILYQNRRQSAMRLGFGHLSTAEIEEAFSILKNCIVNEK